jgi:hypothetical protein
VLSVSATGAAVYRKVAPIALGYERELLAALGPGERAALERILDVLTLRAQVLADTTVVGHVAPPRRGRSRRPGR